MPRKPEIGNVQLYPNRPLRRSDKNGYVLKFYCPIRGQRIRKNCGTRDRREARKVQRECIERLINGEYLASGGAITAKDVVRGVLRRECAAVVEKDRGLSWDECYERYRQFQQCRVREKSLTDLLSRLDVAERILAKHIGTGDGAEALFVRDCFTLEGLELLQERLLAGDECRYDRRSPNTVNSMMAAVMAFVGFCHRHEWIDRVPDLRRMDSDEVMRGRPITLEEFERLLSSTPEVVGKDAAVSWKWLLRILWESGFRIGDVMDFSWDDERHIHPKWAAKRDEHSTIVIPATQKNGRFQVIPMLPGLDDFLRTVPQASRAGWIVNPRPLDGDSDKRLTTEWVSRIVARIGEKAGVIVRQADERNGIRVKYASAHDLRRGCALRLINAGVSAETLKVVMRHADFGTTQKHYGAIRSPQAAGAELAEKLTPREFNAFVGGYVGGIEPQPHLSEVEAKKLKALLASL